MISSKTISELATGLRKKELSAVDLAEEALGNVKSQNPEFNALITIVDREKIFGRARAADELIKQDKAISPLCGIPYVLKDSYLTRGIQTTAASNVLRGYQGQYDATVYKRLEECGAVLVGKANMDAWGHGASNENSDFGPVKNPYETSRVAGGSGGGVAAAIAAGMASFGIGEDTGGSIRNPAAWTNTSALKVTYGRVSRYGCIAYASSFDTVGPAGKTVEDCALVLAATAGRDPLDASSSSHQVPDYAATLNEPIKGKKLGWPKNLLQDVNEEILEALLEARAQLEKLGMEVVEISMPLLSYGIALYYIIAPSETSSNLARYDGVRYGQRRGEFGEEAKRRIMIGTYALSAGYYDAYYKKALQVRTLLVEEYGKAFSQVDCLLMPVTPYHPTKIGEFVDDPIQNMLTDIYTVTQNPAGVPSLALPCGFSKDGLPIGMQLVGRMFSEDMLLNIGHQYQQVTDWCRRKP